MRRIYISNEKKVLGSVCVVKADATNPNLKLGGAVFSLYRMNEKKGRYEKRLSDLVTRDDGTLILEGLIPGEYMLVEDKSPKGYVFDNTKVPFCIDLDDEGKIIQLDTILILNRPERKSCNCCKYFLERFCCNR